MVGIFAASILILSPTLAAATHVTPTVLVGSMPTCMGVDSSWIELKDEGLVNGMLSDGVVSVTFTYSGSGPDSVEWTATMGSLDAVIVKAATNANLYRYDPPAEETFDTGLVPPTSQDISHVSFCYDEDVIGGTGIQIDTTSLLLTGAQMNAAWMIPVIVSAIGIGIVIARKF